MNERKIWDSKMNEWIKICKNEWSEEKRMLTEQEKHEGIENIVVF